ncbi:MAG: S-adenosylmethionine:tRNA ribosyltransferase-isomerase, partial [Flavisolibacter sp.]
MELYTEQYLISRYQYELPPERIAAHPLENRDQSKLLVYRNGIIRDDHFHQLPGYLPEGSTIIVNDTRVIEARLMFTKPTGGTIEIFCLEPHGQTMEEALQRQHDVQWHCLIGGASKWKPGQVLQKELVIANTSVLLSARFISREEEHFIIEFSWEPASLPFSSILHGAGDIPLPPYIKRKTTVHDSDRYQTVFGNRQGSVAAPTSALHFTQTVFESLKARKITRGIITLHVGAGTFKPVKSESVLNHVMHREPFSVSQALVQKILDANILMATGTTTLRTLESLYWLGVKILKNRMGYNELGQWEAYELHKQFPGISKRESLEALHNYIGQLPGETINGYTSLMIVPGYRFRVADALLTNFHQPQSTLLLLV